MDALNYRVASDDALDDALDMQPDKFCMICLAAFAESGEGCLVLSKCHHKFHRACIMKSFQKLATQERLCPYCRTVFSHLPFMGGTHIKGLHMPKTAKNAELHGKLIPHTHIAWCQLDPQKDRVYIHRGKHGFQAGFFERCTASMVYVRLTFDTGKTSSVRVARDNISLIVPKTDEVTATPSLSPSEDGNG
jgi:hypothetical protein